MKRFFIHMLVSFSSAVCLLALFTVDATSQWIPTMLRDNTVSFAVSGTTLFAGTFGGGVFLSTNDGIDWTEASAGVTNRTVLALAASGSNLFAGTKGGVFRSSDNGTSWSAVNTGLTNSLVSSLAVSGTNLFAGTYGGGVFLSGDDGESWTAVGEGSNVPVYVNTLA